LAQTPSTQTSPAKPTLRPIRRTSRSSASSKRVHLTSSGTPPVRPGARGLRMGIRLSRHRFPLPKVASLSVSEPRTVFVSKLLVGIRSRPRHTPEISATTLPPKRCLFGYRGMPPTEYPARKRTFGLITSKPVSVDSDPCRECQTGRVISSISFGTRVRTSQPSRVTKTSSSSRTPPKPGM